MQDLYKGFKKVAEDDSKAVLEHENGHRLNIAKSGLNRKQIAMLKKLPLHQAQGTNPLLDEEQDAGEELKQVGRNIADAVAENIVEGASEATSTQVTPQLSPEQIAQMPEPTATSVETGEPIAPGIGAEPAETRRPLPPHAFLTPFDAPMMLPGETGKQYQARKQQEYDEYQQQQLRIEEAEKAQQQRLGGPGIFSVLQPPQPTTQETTLAPESTVPQDQQQLQQPRISVPQKPTVDLTMPVVAPAVIRPPEEVMVDPSASETDRANAFFQAAMNTQAKIQAASDAFRSELQKPENRLNPNRFFEDMSVPRKITTALGMLLGGFAQGLTGQENPVLKLLDKEIDRDIQAQMQAREDKLSLFKINLQSLKDAQAAYNQTATQLRTILDMRMEEAKRKLDPTNQAGRLALEAAMIENKSKIAKANEELGKVELRRQYEEGAKRGQIVEIPDELDERKDRIVRVADAKGNLVKYYTRTPGAVKEAQDRADALNTAQEVLKKLNNFNKQYGFQFDLAGPIQAKMASAAETLNQEALFAVQQLISKGNISERNADLFKNVFPYAGAFKQEDAQNKAVQAAALLQTFKKQLIEGSLIK